MHIGPGFLHRAAVRIGGYLRGAAHGDDLALIFKQPHLVEQ